MTRTSVTALFCCVALVAMCLALDICGEEVPLSITTTNGICRDYYPFEPFLLRIEIENPTTSTVLIHDKAALSLGKLTIACGDSEPKILSLPMELFSRTVYSLTVASDPIGISPGASIAFELPLISVSENRNRRFLLEKPTSGTFTVAGRISLPDPISKDGLSKKIEFEGALDLRVVSPTGIDEELSKIWADFLLREDFSVRAAVNAGMLETMRKESGIGMEDSPYYKYAIYARYVVDGYAWSSEVRTIMENSGYANVLEKAAGSFIKSLKPLRETGCEFAFSEAARVRIAELEMLRGKYGKCLEILSSIERKGLSYSVLSDLKRIKRKSRERMEKPPH